jgi:signal transduction histidine kinase/CheY-like chemotaxis protein
MNIDTKVIRAEPHVEVGSVIERDAEPLVERWCTRAATEQPRARRIHYEALRDQFPGFLRAMGRGLSAAGSAEQSERAASAVEHGGQRWDVGWSLGELVRDYQILQLVILEHLEETLGRALRYREVMAIGVFIDDAVAASLVTYVEHRDAHVLRVEQERAEALQQANRHKDEFIAALAHELRNPLAPIMNSVKVLQLLLGSADATVLDSISIVERQTKQLGRLVDDLLDLARIAQGKLELRKVALDLRTVLEQSVQMSEPTIKSRDHQLAIDLPNEPLLLEADPARLVQIVVNLLNNAAKYTDRGGRVWLVAGREGDHAVVRVRDSGTGIPPEMLSRVFEMFVQVDSAGHNARGGLGIGLTLVRRLTELHGGTVMCLSPGLGHGSEFIVRLPMRAQPTPAAPTAELPASAHSCHVIVIEDDADSRESLARLLRLAGHRIEVAATGAEGLERARVCRPQAALVDIGLPDITGYEVAKRLRSEHGGALLLVALTGHCQPADLRLALDSGFDAHLIKPAELSEIARVLARLAPRTPPGTAPGD